MNEKVSLDAVRRSNRFRVIMNIPLRIGLKRATLVDISTTGVLATHTGMLKTGVLVDITFTHQDRMFSASSTVASCTVIGLGAGEGGATLYATRLYFVSLTDASRAMLEGMVGESATA